MRYVWLTIGIALFACDRGRIENTPEAVVEAFVDRMRSVHGDPVNGRLALQLLGKDGVDNLRERARRASAVSGRPVAPEEMLVPSRFSLNFEPVHYTSEIKGKWSRVTVTGANPKTQLAEVSCVKEEDKWKVHLQFPPLPPIEKRRD